MNKKMLLLIFLPLITMILVIGCVTDTPVTHDEVDLIPEGIPPVESESQAEEELKPVEPDTASPPADTEEENESQTDPSGYEPTEDEFVSTFSQVETLINELNQIIRERNFELWVDFLTNEYRQQLSKPEVLEEINQRPAIQNRGLTVKTLEDYFLYVVVPSRANLRLDDLLFITDSSVNAIMKIGDVRVTLYQLLLENGSWKIGEF